MFLEVNYVVFVTIIIIEMLMGYANPILLIVKYLTQMEFAPNVSQTLSLSKVSADLLSVTVKNTS